MSEIDKQQVIDALLKHASVKYGDVKDTGQEVDCCLFQGVCYTGAQDTHKDSELDMTFDNFTKEELQQTSLVGVPLVIGHNQDAHAGTIVQDKTDPETGCKRILVYMPQSSLEGVFASNVLKQGVEAELSLQHFFRTEVRADDTCSVAKTPTHVGLVLNGRRANCKLDWSDHSKMTPARASALNAYADSLRQKAAARHVEAIRRDHGVVKHDFRGRDFRVAAGLASASATGNEPQSQSGILASNSGDNSSSGTISTPPVAHLLPLGSSPPIKTSLPRPMENAPVAPTEPTQQQPGADSAPVPPSAAQEPAAQTALAAEAPATEASSVVDDKIVLQQTVNAMLSLVNQQKALEAKLAALSAAQAPAPVPAPVAPVQTAPKPSDDLMLKLLLASIESARQIEGVDKNALMAASCAAESSALTPGTALALNTLVNGLASAASVHRPAIADMQAQTRAALKRPAQVDGAQAPPAKQMLTTSQAIADINRQINGQNAPNWDPQRPVSSASAQPPPPAQHQVPVVPMPAFDPSAFMQRQQAATRAAAIGGQRQSSGGRSGGFSNAQLYTSAPEVEAMRTGLLQVLQTQAPALSSYREWKNSLSEQDREDVRIDSPFSAPSSRVR